ncbi:hypothetical protein CQW23_06370 [Capsicum baccatum]|uniref:Terpene synthase metal-binding domain-containing protein n=1 Tax=Capsicum baccatum TaxID=33114 RepID=A0A2G2X347_CAPBA|nr:hypothetical protein CQW23_06370 [Capsicum baccatum]
MELSIANHRMTSPIFDSRKEVTEFKNSSEDQIGESMKTTMSFMKPSIRQNLKEEAPKKQMQEVKNQSTLKELQERVYPFPDPDVNRILDELLAKEVIELRVYFEPQYSVARKILTRISYFLSIIDDTYDIYGMLDELTLLTEAIERWNIDASEQLPLYMKIVYCNLLDVYNEIEKELANENKSFLVNYSIMELTNKMEANVNVLCSSMKCRILSHCNRGLVVAINFRCFLLLLVKICQNSPKTNALAR